MSLQDKLDARVFEVQSQAPREALEIMHRATVDLKASGIMERVVTVGDKAPEFELRDSRGDVIQLRQLIAEHDLVLCFYRGKW
jgi:hypothetical protein